MTTQQKPKQQEPKPVDPGRQPAGRPQSAQESPRGPKNPTPPPLPGDEADVQSDVTAEKGEERQRQGTGGPRSPDQPRYGNTGGNRSGGQDDR